MQLETSVTNIILKFDNDVNDRNNRIIFFRCLGLGGGGEAGVVCFVLFFTALAYSREALVLNLSKPDIESPEGNKYKTL